jgi:hypothetical protein
MKVPLITVPYVVPRMGPQSNYGVDTFEGYMHFSVLICLIVSNASNAIWWRSVNANELQTGTFGSIHYSCRFFSIMIRDDSDLGFVFVSDDGNATELSGCGTIKWM